MPSARESAPHLAYYDLRQFLAILVKQVMAASMHA